MFFASSRATRGFTLIELLIVVAVIGLIAAVVLPKFGNAKDKAYVTAMKNDLRNLASAQEFYFEEHNTYALADALPGFYYSDDVSVATDPAPTATSEQWSASLVHSKTDESCALTVGKGIDAQNKIRCTTDGSVGGGEEEAGPNVAPTAAFAMSHSSPIEQGTSVTFTDQSSDVAPGVVNSWNWSFGDGGSATVPNPTHTFSTAGTWTVTLTVTDNGGATDQHSQTVEVTAPAVSARYWRMNMTANNGGAYSSLAELGFRATPGGATITGGGSPIGGWTEPWKAFDKDGSTFTYTQGGVRSLGYDFGSPVSIAEAVLVSRSAFPEDHPRDFFIQYSSDNVTWTTALSVTGETNWGPSEARVYSIP